MYRTMRMVRMDLGRLGDYLRTWPYGRFGRNREVRYHQWLIRRYVGHGGRFRLMMGNGRLLWPRPRQRLFQYRLRRSARRVSTKDLNALLDLGWRESVAASWLIAAGRRADLRPRIGRDLLGDNPSGYGWDYCTALACLGTEEDAQLLRRYLDRALVVPKPVDPHDDGHCQWSAIGALLHLDDTLGTTYAQPLLAPGGLWEQWAGEDAAAKAERARFFAEQGVVFAAGGKPKPDMPEE